MGRFAWSGSCEDATEIELAAEDRRDKDIVRYSSVAAFRDGCDCADPGYGEDCLLVAVANAVGGEEGDEIGRRGISCDRPVGVVDGIFQ